LGIFGGKNKKKCEICIGRGREFLISGSYILAAREYTDVITDLDPDNKTGLHLWAYYGIALSSLAMAFLQYSQRIISNLDFEKYIAQAEQNIQLETKGGIIVENLEEFIKSQYTDNFIVYQLQQAIYYFEKTRDLSILSSMAGVTAATTGEGIKISESPDWNVKATLVSTIRKEPRWGRPLPVYSLEPLDLHCRHGLRDAKRLLHLILVEHHHQEQHDDIPHFYREGVPCPCTWVDRNNVCSVCSIIGPKPQSFFNEVDTYKQFVRQLAVADADATHLKTCHHCQTCKHPAHAHVLPRDDK
jgi:hypothetical protein